MQTIRSVTARYVIILLLCYAGWIALYYLTAWIGELRGAAFSPALALDGVIPFIPSYLYIYLFCYVIVLAIPLMSRDPAFLNRAYLAFIWTNLFAFVFFAVFPSQGPPRHPPAGSSEALLQLLYQADSRWNALPSLHVANPWLVALFAVREKGVSAWSALLFLLALGISVSTLFIKQHYLLDVVSGMVLAFVAFAVAEMVNVRNAPWRLPWEPGAKS
jgi:membrane-associated phospholipid phosphatase